MCAAMSVHVTVGGSAAGNVRELIKGREVDRLVVVEEWFSVGPLFGVSEPGGLEARRSYFRKIFEKIGWAEIFREFEPHLGTSDLYRIPAQTDHIVVWCGANAEEQILLRAVCAIWSEIPLTVVDVRNLGVDYEKRSAVGGCAIEELRRAESAAAILCPDAVERLAVEWRRFLSEEALLRLFVDGHVIAVDEAYFDSMLIELCPGNAFVSAARLVGAVMGRSPYLIGDAFLDYRLRELIAEGIIETRGGDHRLNLMQVRRR